MKKRNWDTIQMRQATACNMLSMVDLQVLSLEGYLSVRQLYYLALGQDAMWGNYEINVNSDFTVLEIRHKKMKNKIVMKATNSYTTPYLVVVETKGSTKIKRREGL